MYPILINREILCVYDWLSLSRAQHELRRHFGIFQVESLKRGERRVWGTNYDFVENGVGQFSGVWFIFSHLKVMYDRPFLVSFAIACAISFLSQTQDWCDLSFSLISFSCCISYCMYRYMWAHRCLKRFLLDKHLLVDLLVSVKGQIHITVVRTFKISELR